MSDPLPTPTAPTMPSRWTARIGLIVVAALLVGCFGMLIAAQAAQ